MKLVNFAKTSRAGHLIQDPTYIGDLVEDETEVVEKALLDKAIEALKFYEKEENYKTDFSSKQPPKVRSDFGELARETLKELGVAYETST